MGQHAFLSASSAHRWLECPPSAKACEGQEDRASPYAKQGTDCHELCAYLVEKSLGRDAADPTESLEYYDREMQDCAESYCAYVMEQVEAAAASAAEKAGYDPYEKKLLGITAMTALMGKKKFEEVLGSYITKPQGKPALVPESDKRPAINTAYEDFSEN